MPNGCSNRRVSWFKAMVQWLANCSIKNVSFFKAIVNLTLFKAHMYGSMHASQHFKTEIDIILVICYLYCNAIKPHVMQWCCGILSFSISGSVQVPGHLVPDSQCNWSPDLLFLPTLLTLLLRVLFLDPYFVIPFQHSILALHSTDSRRPLDRWLLLLGMGATDITDQGGWQLFIQH